MKNKLLFLFLIFQSSIIYSQIISDRPSQTDSPLVIGENYIQIETGILIEEIKSDINTLIRIGIFDGFELYSGLDGLYSMFANEALLLIFWLHFLAISLFAGSWIVRDSKRYFIPKVITIPSLFLTYFTGPIGLVIYWFFRIFFAKKISFND